MAEAYNNTATTLPEITEDFFAFLVVPPVTYFRNLQTKARGVLREDSFLRVTSTQEEAESVRVYLKENYGVDTQVVPLSVNFTGDSNVSLSLRRLVDVEAIDREPDVGDLIQYTGKRVLINGVDSPRYTFGRIDTQYVEEHTSNLYYTNSKVSSHIAATSLDTLTPDESDNSTKIATTEYVKTAIGNLIDNAPSALDTLNELAAALGNDENFHTTLLSSNAAIQTELDATQTGAGLTGAGTYEADSNTRYLQSAESLKNADSILDSKIFAIQNELDATQTGAGLDTDGSYTASTSDYISTATSLKDADEKLAAQAKVNEDAIAAETTARQNADSTLQSNIDSEASTRATEDAALGTRIDSEASTRETADTALQSNIDSEASTRATADTNLQSNIDSEASTRATADSALDTRIDDLHAVATSGSYNDLSDKPTIPSGVNLDGYATESYVNTAISDLVANAPEALDTLNELAAALGDNSNFSTTITNQLANKANISDIPSAYSLPTASPNTKGGITTNYTTNGRNYAVQMSGTNAYVNVPWEASSGGSSYTLPTAGNGTLGGIELGYTETGKNYPVELSNSKAYVNVPWENTVYTLPTAGNATLGGITTNYNTNVPSRNYAVQMSGTNAYVNVPVPAADAQNLGGVKVSFSGGNLYISTS